MSARDGRQFCRTGLHTCVPTVTLTFDGGTRRLHWCAEHADDADRYRPDSDQALASRPVGKTTRLSVNGSTSVVVTPPLPCGLTGCVAELHITHKHGDTTRVHLNARQRREAVIALGGTMPATGGLPDDALPDADERARQRAGTDR